MAKDEKIEALNLYTGEIKSFTPSEYKRASRQWKPECCTPEFDAMMNRRKERKRRKDLGIVRITNKMMDEIDEYLSDC